MIEIIDETSALSKKEQSIDDSETAEVTAQADDRQGQGADDQGGKIVRENAESPSKQTLAAPVCPATLSFRSPAQAGAMTAAVKVEAQKSAAQAAAKKTCPDVTGQQHGVPAKMVLC